MDKFTLSFNGNVTVAENAKAYIYEEETEIAQSVSMSVNSDDASVVDIDFGNAILYNSHKYSIRVPENSILSASDGSGYQEICLNNYQGASYKHLTLTSATPADNSEVLYLRDVEMNFEFPEGYNLGYHSQDCKMYLYKDGTDEPVGTYTADYNTLAEGLIVHISKYDLEPGTTYRVVLPEGQIVPGKIGEALSQYDLKDTSNPEIVLTYTTPSTLSEFPRVSGMTCGIEDDGSIKVVVPSYKFDGLVMSVYPIEGAAGVTKKTEIVNDGFGDREKISWFVTCQLNDNTDGAQTKVGDMEMEFTPNPYSDDEVWLVGTAPQTLYMGRTYNLVIPAGTLAPKDMGEGAYSFVSNEETALAMEGTADPTGINVSGGMAEDMMLAQLGVVAFYADGTVTAADGATVKLMQGDEAVKEVPAFVADASGKTIVIADFSDENHAPFALEDGAAYTVVLPQGSVLGADGIVTNPERTVAFTGANLVPEAETVSVTLTVGGNASSVTEAIKGRPYAVTVTPEADWTVEALTVGGEDVTAGMEGNVYTIAELTGDTEIIATLAYTGELTIADVMTGIASVEGTDIRAYSEGDEIVVEGLQAGDRITVYTVGGMKVASHEATQDSVRINAPKGMTYIVRVNNHGIKMAH